MSLSIYGTPITKRLADGRTMVTGIFAWSTTDATGDLNCSGLKVLHGVEFTPINATYETKDFPQINVTPATDGTIHVGSGGTIPVVRNTAGTSAAKCLYRLIGY